PVCGQTCVPGISSENLTCPWTLVVASFTPASSAHVLSTSEHPAWRSPRLQSDSCRHSPFSRRSSCSSTNGSSFPVPWSLVLPFSLVLDLSASDFEPE